MKLRFTNKLVLALSLPLFIASCDGDEEEGALSADFGSIASTAPEGAGTITIPLRNAGGSTASKLDVTFGGTATEGEDYSLVGITAEGVQISIIDDAAFEGNETIKVHLTSSSINLNGNSDHTVTILSNCEDLEGITAAAFAGDWNATEFYCGLGVTTGSCDYGPYVAHLVVDPTDPMRLNFDNFYDSGYDVYMVFNMANGTVSFPNQNAVGDSSNPAITASTGTFEINVCEGTGELIIDLNYDGGDWTYHFVRI